MTTETGIYEVVWPRGKKIAESTQLAKRLDTLVGKTICELWDWLFRGDQIFAALEKELTRRYPGIKLINYQEFGRIAGENESEVLAALPDKLKQYKCDAVISGLGC